MGEKGAKLNKIESIRMPQNTHLMQRRFRNINNDQLIYCSPLKGR